MKKTLMGLVLFALLVFAGFIIGHRLKNPERVEHPRRGPLTEAIYGLGTVQADTTFTLKLGVTASIRSLFVKEGDFIKKGEPLVRFDDSSGQNERAPFDGTVNQVFYSQGETVFPQSPVISMIALKDRSVRVNLSQDVAVKVRSRQKARLRFESLKNQAFDGEVRSIFPQQGQIIASILVKELPPEILPGMTADVSIIVSEKQGALLVPLKAVQKGQIQIEKNGDWMETKVELGIIGTEWAEVLSPELLESDRLLLPKE